MDQMDAIKLSMKAKPSVKKSPGATPTAAELAERRAEKAAAPKPAPKPVAKPAAKPLFTPPPKPTPKPVVKAAPKPVAKPVAAKPIAKTAKPGMSAAVARFARPKPVTAVTISEEEKAELFRKYFSDPENATLREQVNAVAPLKKVEIHITDAKERPVRCSLVLAYESGTEYRPVIYEDINGFYADTLPSAKYRVQIKTGLIFKKDRVDYMHVKGDTLKEIRV